MIVKRGKGDFHRTYRPCKISEVIGNDEVKRILEKAFKDNEVPQAFLFYGLRGTGKTTMARIIEMGLNCEKGPTSEPCCECSYCRRIINRSGSLAVREINAVAVLKDELKEMLSDFHWYNSGLIEGLEKNILLVDECHGLTAEQAGLFLTYVEDVPEGRYYVFCTTNPEKFLPTLRDRCVIQVEFKEVPDNEIMKLLSEICEQEKIKPDIEVLNDIVKKSKGMPRIAVHELQKSYLAGKLKKKRIQTLSGNNNILVIAPHGHPKDDFNTGKIARRMHDKFGCYAVINEEYQKPESAGLSKPDISKGIADLYDWNHINNFKELKEDFLDPVEDFKKKILSKFQMLYIIHIHGIDDENIRRVAKITVNRKNEPDNLHVLVGYGQRDNDNSRHTADLVKFVQPFIKEFDGEGLRIEIAPTNTIVGVDGKDKLYCGNDPDKLNQRLYEPKDKIQSIQLEIKNKNARENQDQAIKTADRLCMVLSKIITDTPLLPAQTEHEDPIVAKAFVHLKEIFQRHFHGAMLEAGRYLIKTFYEGNPKAAFAKNKTKEQPPSLKRLMEKIQQTSNSPSESAPSTGWLYNAVNLAAHEAICEQEGFQTFGILGHSHKLQLLHVPKLKQIEIDKFDEAIKPAFKEKERLASVAVEEKLSVRGFKAYINEQHPDDSGTIDLLKLPPLNELRQRESKELLRLWNLAKTKIDEGQKMMGIYSTAIHKLGIVLAETNTNAELGKGRFQDWTKSKNNVNICTGCKNDCVYCFMKPMNARNPKLKQPEDWHNWELRQDDVDQNYGLRDGLVGFPSSHDIFPDILDASLSVLGKILRAGNEVLIVSKPRLECIKAICAASPFFKDKILFRFTIGAMSDEILSYWEPNSPAYDERKECLEYAFHNGFQTSVSMEPMLDTQNIEALVKDLLPFVSEDIWLGTMNHLSWIKKGADKRLLSELETIEAGQTPERLLEIDEIYENNPKIKWKTDALKIIERAKERKKKKQKRVKGEFKGSEKAKTITEDGVEREATAMAITSERGFDRNRRYELTSAFQKSIRWCEINDSRYFARQLMEMGFPGTVFNRLIIIAAEDVGLADPSLVVYERECSDSFENLIKQNKMKKRDAVKFPTLCEIVDRAVIAAAIAYKSRLLPQFSFATLFDIYQNEDFSKNLPEYLDRFVEALGMKDEKQALYYAYVAGIFLNSMDKILALIQRQIGLRNGDLNRKWVDEYKRKGELLMLAGSVALLCRDLNYKHGEYEAAVSQYLPLRIMPATIPDRAYDRHTLAGKRRGRGLEHFFDEAATVKNERFPNNWEQAGRNSYISAEKKGLEKAVEIVMAIKEKHEKYKKPYKPEGIYN